MKKEMSEALLEFYQQILRPEFAGIHAKLAEHDERFREIDGHFDHVYHRLGRLDQEMLATNHGLKRLEGHMDKLVGRMDGLDGRMDGLDGRMDGLDGRMDGLEFKVDGIAADLSAHRRDTEAHGKGYLVSE